MQMEEYTIGIDIGGTNIRIGSGGPLGGMEDFLRVPREMVLSGEHSMESLAEFICLYIEKYRSGRKPGAVVVGFPATLSKDRRRILQAPNVPGLDQVAAADELERLLRVPVYLERDVNLLFYRDMKKNGLPETGLGIGVYIGTGIGNAIFIEGVPLAGKDGSAGELGHIAIQGSSSVCGCGNVGCSECMASGRHLVELRDRHFPETPVEKLFEIHSGTEVLREYVDNIACVIASEVNILNPDYIVLGGGVLNTRGFPLEELKRRIYAHARKPYPAESLTYYFSRDAQENGVQGAVAYAWALLKKAA